MKKVGKFIAVFLLCVLSYWGGAFFHGHRYEEREIQAIPFEFGEIKVVSGVDRSGPDLLPMGAEWIQFTGEEPLDYAVILFRSDMRVKSPKPQLQHLVVNGKDISWDDTNYSYRLHIDWLSASPLENSRSGMVDATEAASR
ncbi:hypothetical protein H5P28_17645 [Ruficoccus amylovorans]|uniref:Uncharacterized protein n=1 Tax=Ruficoccus amylovorans TaxID=1804625 RepID=A0A842HH84_9BACT|nr:hypothetical protein [Ruficoccus amylovorans]MBC2596095.1 hypothetical protein [Ruficoccus amylovorans]